MPLRLPISPYLLPFCRWMPEPKTSIWTCSILPFHFPHHAEMCMSAGGHLGHVGQSCWAQLWFSLWTNTKMRKAFLRRNPKALLQEGITEETFGLRHLQERRASFKLNVPMSRLHAVITFMTEVATSQLKGVPAALCPSCSCAPVPQQTPQWRSCRNPLCHWGSAALLAGQSPA